MNHDKQHLGRRTVLKTIGAAGVIGSMSGIATADGHREDLRDLRRAASKYQSLEKAEANGYVLDPFCVEHPTLGAMGFHAVNVDLVDGTVSADEPEILVYEKKDDDYNLVAAEYVSIGGSAPELFGQTFHPTPSLPFDWALHVWAWKNNPNGMFVDWNPRVSCSELEPPESEQ